MQKKISPTELELGMYVILPVAWHEHDFLKNQFLIDSEKQIKKIRELGLKTRHKEQRGRDYFPCFAGSHYRQILRSSGKGYGSP